jgi:hypothetical protein
MLKYVFMYVRVLLGRGVVFLSVRSDEGRCHGNIFLSIKNIIHHLLLGKGGVFLSVSSFSGKLMPARYLCIKLRMFVCLSVSVMAEHRIGIITAPPPPKWF